jgi:hypothetical protein
MEKSTEIKQIAGALKLFSVKMEKITKDSQNPFFKSKYASLEIILDSIQLPLGECGLSFTQFPDGEHGLTTLLMHDSGEYLQATYTMRPVKDDPQGLGSCITYQRRYALCSILGLNIAEDDDANAASAPKEDDGRPWLTEQALNAALKRLQAGEKDVYGKTISAFKMKKQYREQLDKFKN